MGTQLEYRRVTRFDDLLPPLANALSLVIGKKGVGDWMRVVRDYNGE